MIIHLGLPLPTGSSNQPESSADRLQTLSYLVLLQGGVYLASPVTEVAGALLPHPLSLTVGFPTRSPPTPVPEG
ncbi:MAG: hypothetical protein ACJATT_002524 [Myxococcota bacterium]|jgi:hypothetical protein